MELTTISFLKSRKKVLIKTKKGISEEMPFLVDSIDILFND